MDKIIFNQNKGENILLTCKVLRQKISLKFKKISEISEKQYFKHLVLPLPQCMRHITLGNMFTLL